MEQKRYDISRFKQSNYKGDTFNKVLSYWNEVNDCVNEYMTKISEDFEREFKPEKLCIKLGHLSTFNGIMKLSIRLDFSDTLEYITGIINVPLAGAAAE